MAAAYRRMLLSLVHTTRYEGLPAASAVYLGRHLAEPGTPLPVDFPSRDRLVAAHYTAIEDLQGADEDELIAVVGLTQYQARIVLGALP